MNRLKDVDYRTLTFMQKSREPLVGAKLVSAKLVSGEIGVR
jgi:hypothetical protein